MSYVARFAGVNLKVAFAYNKKLVAEIKDTGVAKWDGKTKTWTLKPSLDALKFIINNKFKLSDDDTNKLSECLNKELAKQKLVGFRTALAKEIKAPPIPELRLKLLFDPKPYQWIPSHYSTFCDARFILADEQRLGKCREATMVTLHPKFCDHPVIIFCPASVVGTWQRELEKAFGILSYAVDGPMDQLVPGYRYYVASYERMRQIDDLNWFVIIDESHNIKESSSIRGKQARRFGWNAEHIILITGTPIVNRPLELFNQLNIIDPNFLDYTEYTKRFCAAKWTPFGKDVSGASNLPGLHRLIYSNYVVRRERSQVWPTQVKKTRITVDLCNRPIPKDSPTKNLYFENAQWKAENQEFLHWLTDLLKKEKKVLLFCHHDSMVASMEELLSKLRTRYIKIVGGMNGEEKDQECQKFQNDPRIGVALLGITAASEGISLFAGKTVVFLEAPQTPGRFKQAEDRCVGFEDEAEITIYMPVVSILEKAAYARLLKKAHTQQVAISGSIEDDEEDDVMESVAKDLGIPFENKKKNAVEIEESHSLQRRGYKYK